MEDDDTVSLDDAAVRLEAALDRIAARGGPPAPLDKPAELAERLDALIARLHGVLGLE